MDNFNRFAMNPTSVNITRSRFPRPSDLKTTFNSGELVPIYLDEVLPGDTISMDTAAVVRMSTPIAPSMDNAFLDVYYFFVPTRLVWDHAKEFFGENTNGPWAADTEYIIPQIKVSKNAPASILTYLGVPDFSLAQDNGYISVSALPYRAYCLIWNEWFRDQNYSIPIPVPKDDSTFTARFDTIGNWFTSDTNYPAYAYFRSDGNKAPLPVAKFHDFFTSCLPEPQKGPAVTLSILNEGDSLVPVGTYDATVSSDTLNYEPLYWFRQGTTNFTGSGYLYNTATQGTSSLGGVNVNGTYPSYSQNNPVVPGNLFADLGGFSVASINTLREAIAIQAMYEKDARGGTRYREIIKSHFGVTSLDARQQIPEFLHGKRIPITMQQVVQTSSTDSTSPQGNTAAFSLTQDNSNSFTYSATEHGYIIGLACVRSSNTYFQGLDKLWSRKRRFDFYWPVFANLGEQPVMKSELLALGWNNGINSDVFGFQEAWAEYRYKPSKLSGLFANKTFNDTNPWTYAESFGNAVSLSEAFIYEPKKKIAKTLAVQDEPQFIANFYFNSTWVRPMPMYSIPAMLGRL